MNLTQKLKAKIVREFKLGRDLSEFCVWYDKDIWMIEDVIRQELIRLEQVGPIAIKTVDNVAETTNHE